MHFFRSIGSNFTSIWRRTPTQIVSLQTTSTPPISNAMRQIGNINTHPQTNRYVSPINPQERFSGRISSLLLQQPPEIVSLPPSYNELFPASPVNSEFGNLPPPAYSSSEQPPPEYSSLDLPPPYSSCIQTPCTDDFIYRHHPRLSEAPTHQARHGDNTCHDLNRTCHDLNRRRDVIPSVLSTPSQQTRNRPYYIDLRDDLFPHYPNLIPEENNHQARYTQQHVPSQHSQEIRNPHRHTVPQRSVPQRNGQQSIEHQRNEHQSNEHQRTRHQRTDQANRESTSQPRRYAQTRYDATRPLSQQRTQQQMMHAQFQHLTRVHPFQNIPRPQCITSLHDLIQSQRIQPVLRFVNEPITPENNRIRPSVHFQTPLGSSPIPTEQTPAYFENQRTQPEIHSYHQRPGSLGMLMGRHLLRI